MKAPRPCTKVMLSPSKIPQKQATTGSIYVTDEAKIGDEIWISLKYTTFATQVPATASIPMKSMDVFTLGRCATSKKLELHKTTNAGTSNTAKFPTVILKGVKSERYFLIKFTLTE